MCDVNKVDISLSLINSLKSLIELRGNVKNNRFNKIGGVAMERAFKIVVGSKVHEEWTQWVETREINRLFINEFFTKYGVESNPYTFGGDGYCNVPFEEDNKNKIYLGIKPTEDDLASFGSQLCKPNNRGVSYFKKSSKILKDFQQECIDKGIVINQTPLEIQGYFKSMGYTRHRVSHVPFDDTWLVKIENDYLAADDNPEGFEPIKLSEYYTYVESLNN